MASSATRNVKDILVVIAAACTAVATVFVAVGWVNKTETDIKSDIKIELTRFIDENLSSFERELSDLETDLSEIDNTITNMVPYPRAIISNREIAVGEAEDIILDSYFFDPSGKIKQYSYDNSSIDIVAVSFPNPEQASSMRINGLKQGRARVTAYAHDEDENKGEQSFWVTVVEATLTCSAASSETPWRLNAVTWNGERFVAVGDGGTILQSTDGSVWKQTNIETRSALRGVTWNGERFVAVGWGGSIVYSADGNEWKTATGNPVETKEHPETSLETSLEGVVWDGDLFVLVGGGGTIARSKDGDTWKLDNTDEINWPASGDPRTKSLEGVAWNGERFVAVGRDGTILYTDDNGNWTFAPSEITKDLVDIVWNGERFVAVGQSRTLALSDDGIEWSVLPLDDELALGYIFGLASNGELVVVAEDQHRIYYSIDGMTWSYVDIDIGEGLDIYGLSAADGKRFVAVGGGGTILNCSY